MSHRLKRRTSIATARNETAGNGMQDSRKAFDKHQKIKKYDAICIFFVGKSGEVWCKILTFGVAFFIKMYVCVF